MRITKRSQGQFSGKHSDGQCTGRRTQGQPSHQARALNHLEEETRSIPTQYPKEDLQRGMGRFVSDGKTVGKFVSVDDQLSVQNFSQEAQDAKRQELAASKGYDPVAFTDMTGREFEAGGRIFPRGSYPYLITSHFMPDARLENLTAELRHVNWKIRQYMGPVAEGEREEWHMVAAVSAAAEYVRDEDLAGHIIASEREGGDDNGMVDEQPIDGKGPGDERCPSHVRCPRGCPY